MKIRGARELQRAGRWLRSRFVSSGLILLYHRIAEINYNVASDFFSLSVTPQHFAEQLAVLYHMTTPISLRELTLARRESNLPGRSVVVTFDDGYADNLYLAKPLLEHYQIPATIFVTTGFLGQAREFWWDELTRLVMHPKMLPYKPCLTINGQIYKWTSGNSASDSSNSFRGHSFLINNPNTRLHLLRSLYQRLRPLSSDERRNVLEQLWSWAGSEFKYCALYHALSSDEVRDLAAGELLDIGAHTVTHPILSALPAAAQQREIHQCKTHLTEILGHTVASFSYPYGLPSDYTSQSIDHVRDLGFSCACSAFNDVVWRGSVIFQLPRFWVQDWNGETFARQLSMWLHKQIGWRENRAIIIHFGSTKVI